MGRKIVGITVGTTMNPKRLGEYIDDGKSAYELAVDNGFKGTEQEWLASLNGTDGYTPVKGKDYWTPDDMSEITEYINQVVHEAEYKGVYRITPSVASQSIETSNRLMRSDVVVEEIPYAEVINNSGGKTVTIAD